MAPLILMVSLYYYKECKLNRSVCFLEMLFICYELPQHSAAQKTDDLHSVLPTFVYTAAVFLSSLVELVRFTLIHKKTTLQENVPIIQTQKASNSKSFWFLC